MIEVPLDNTERTINIISLGWMRFDGPGRDEMFEWPVEKNQAHNGGWVCS